MSVSVDIIPHKSFIEDTAKVNAPPRLATLLQLLHMNGEEIVNPSERNKQNLNPFLIPLSKDKSGSMTCYIRWPTQKDSLDLQIVRTTETGVALRALSTDHLLRRIAAEMDFFSTPKAEEAIKLLTDSGLQYAQGDYLPLLKSGKFEIGSKEELQLVLDRYLLTKVGAFPDCFERLATNFKSKGDEVSALITCERAVSIFYGWGHPMTFHSNMLHSMSDRQKEASDVAKAALGMPLWTLAGSLSELETITQRAGFSGVINLFFSVSSISMHSDSCCRCS